MRISNFLNRKFIFILLPFFVALAVFITVRLALTHPEKVDSLYSTGLYPVIATALAVLSNVIPFSLWDISWIMLILLVLAGLILVISRKIRFRWYLLRLVQTALILYSVFYLFWGLNYFRPGMEDRLGWEKSKPDEKIFKSVLGLLIESCNRTRVKIDSSDYLDINSLIERSYSNNSKLLRISYHEGQRRPKTMLLSSYFAKSEVSGYFGPLFNEVHINQYLYPLDYPFTLAHEKAHQFGFANEAEANMAAFMVCSASDDYRLQYSAGLHMLVYFIHDATRLPDFKDYLSKIDDKVKADIRIKQEYYKKLSNKNLSDIQERANDIYLKTNKINAGVKNYNQVVGLVLSWYNHIMTGDIKQMPLFAQKPEK